MKNLFKNNMLIANIPTALAVSGLALSSLAILPSEASAQTDMAKKPVLVITNKTMTPRTPAPSNIYSTPKRVPEITAAQITAPALASVGETVVGRKINGINVELFTLEARVERLAAQLASVEQQGKSMAASYYASVATINTQLQTGTTPGNPRLVGKLNIAQRNLETLSSNIANLNSLSLEIANAASKGSYLLDTARSTYNLSGAIEEDHVRLAQIEDKINASLVNISRVQSNVNDDITRTTAYLTTERDNLRTLALAVANGDLYGKSLASQTFSYHQSNADMMHKANFSGGQTAPQQRLLAKIKFDKANVAYEQPVYAAVQSAIQKYPHAKFEVVAVHPTSGNTAQQAIESTKARRNAEKVLRSLTQMGLALDKIDLSYNSSNDASTNEVHLFLR